jgi:hypothetical protein
MKALMTAMSLAVLVMAAATVSASALNSDGAMKAAAGGNMRIAQNLAAMRDRYRDRWHKAHDSGRVKPVKSDAKAPSGSVPKSKLHSSRFLMR